MQLPSGRGKVNAWGENHLWLRYRKGSKLSGLVEPRISAALALRVSTHSHTFGALRYPTPKIILQAITRSRFAIALAKIAQTRIANCLQQRFAIAFYQTAVY